MEPTQALLEPTTATSDAGNEEGTIDDIAASMHRRHATFPSTLDPDEAAHLAPSSLPISKAQRAWDRKPQSPFSRKKVRFGKVWKRSNALSGLSQNSSVLGALATFSSFDRDSPARAVKKLRVGEHGEEVVCGWEGRGSPTNRRIVTRSSASGEELVELGEDHGLLADSAVATEEDIVTKVEVNYEDGTVEELDIQDELAQDDWEDESATEEDVDGWDKLRMQQEIDSTDIGDAPAIHVEAVESIKASAEGERETGTSEEQISLNGGQPNESQAPHEPMTNSESVPPWDPESNTGQRLSERDQPSVKVTMDGPYVPPAIPDGFVSPAKARRRPIGSVLRQAHSNRRKTLPVNFAAQEAKTEFSQSAVTENLGRLEPAHIESPAALQQPHEVSTEVATTHNAEIPAHMVAEAIENTSDQSHSQQDQNEVSILTPQASPSQGSTGAVESKATPTRGDDRDEEEITLQINPTITALAESQEWSKKLPSSPLGSTAQHPRLPLRRSPRRKSSSPLKRRDMLSSEGRSHLIAFTPVRYPTSLVSFEQKAFGSSPLPTSPTFLMATGNSGEAFSEITRSSSAPPEEPQMSPRKPFEPRMSDDTATLQAFIKRAAESKYERRDTITRRESLENRRTSDAVRQALADTDTKPAAADVLTDLDPNSPSPRKQRISPETGKTQDALQEDEPPNSPTKRSSRRSTRAKKNAQTNVPSTSPGPLKISVRGSADSVVLKRTEAQEMAALTRTNTRKNKGGAVLPPLRLTKMLKESTEDLDSLDLAQDKGQPGRKCVKWSEMLASFYHGEAEPESSIMTDELNAPEPVPEEVAEKTNSGSVGVPTAPSAAGTPGAPRLRRLKPPRTASISAKDIAAVEPLVSASSTSTNTKPPTKKRARIATPAKLKGVSLLPDGLNDENDQPPKAPTTKKKVMSKLPAPVSVTAGFAQGKENSLIASPPKKKAKPLEAPPPVNRSTAKALTPRLDLVKPISASERKAADVGSVTPGLASPAKKGMRPVILTHADENRTARRSGDELPPSLGSPAKKRMRRVLE